MMLACVRARHRVDGRGKCERRLAAELCGEKNLARVLRPLHRRGWRAQGRAGSCAARQARKARQHARSHQAREHAACRAPTSGLAGGQPQARRRQGQRHSCWSRHVDETWQSFCLFFAFDASSAGKHEILVCFSVLLVLLRKNKSLSVVAFTRRGNRKNRGGRVCSRSAALSGAPARRRSRRVAATARVCGGSSRRVAGCAARSAPPAAARACRARGADSTEASGGGA